MGSEMCIRDSLKDVQQYPLVCLADNTMTYSLYKELYAASGLIFKPEIELATADLMVPVIKHGLGIGFVPKALVEEELKNGEMVEIHIQEKIPPREIIMLENQHHPLSAAARELIKLLRHHIQTEGEL